MRSRLLILICAALFCGCDQNKNRSTSTNVDATSNPEKRLNLYIWNDILAPDTVENFEKETGIEVSVSYYSSDEELEAKLAPGHSGYDIVMPTGGFYVLQIRAGMYQKLDKTKLPNLVNLDPQFQQELTAYDPNNDHAVLHIWSTSGFGYNQEKVKAAAPDAPVDSWDLVFDPTVASKLKKCGIAMLNAPSSLFPRALSAIGRNPESQDAADIQAAADALIKIRPYVRYMDAFKLIPDLASGEICVAVTTPGDILQARARGKEIGVPQQLAYSLPPGSNYWVASYLIPKDAPHPDSAHVFINYMLKPEVIAAVTNAIKNANGNSAATPFVDKELLEDPAVYPPPDVRARLVLDLADTPETTRLMTRLWTKFVTGR